jgi:phosphoglycerate dehydrogenase-like enzyme
MWSTLAPGRRAGVEWVAPGASVRRVCAATPVVGVLFPFAADREMLAALEGVAELRMVGWVDPTEVRRAKSAGTRSIRWIRSHERPLTDAQRGELAAADYLLALDVPVDVATLAPHLGFVQGLGAGVAQLVGVLRGTGIRLCSAAGLSADKVAEFVLARLLGVWTQLRRLDELQRARRWAPEQVETPSVAGRTVLVVGTGGIGQAVARLAAPFGLHVVGVRRHPDLGAPPGFSRVVGPESLRLVLGDADAVVLAAPATNRTRGLVGSEELAAMRPGAILCNVARGSLVDESALVAALESGHLGAAVLDVMAQEPLSRRSRLWTAPRCYLSPHVANSWRPEYVARIAELMADNIERDRDGLPLRNLVDLDEGY